MKLANEANANSKPVEFESMNWHARRAVIIALLAIFDSLAIEACLLLGLITRDWTFALFNLPPLTLSHLSGLALGAILVIGAYAFFGLYPGYGLSAAERIRLRTIGVSVVLLGLAGWDYIVQNNTWSRGVLLIALTYAVFLPAAVNHYLVLLLSKYKGWGEPVIIVGAADAVAEPIEILQNNRVLGYRPVGVLANDPSDWGRTIQGVPLMGPVAKIVSCFPKVALAIVVARSQDEKQLGKLLSQLPYSKLLILPRQLELQSLWVNTRDFDGTLALEIKRNLLRRRNRLLKAIFDYLLAVCVAFVATPIIAIICLWIYTVDPGPPIFRQWREGYGGERLKIFKLRTMYHDAQVRLERHLANDPAARTEWETYFKLRDDPRILPFIGKLLRRFSIDELPQVLNVIRREMSLVGPRPLPDYHVEAMTKETRELRNRVKPGLTGLWQVRLRSDGDLAAMEKLDLYYIDNWSIWLDAAIVLDTLIAVVGGRGAR